MKKMTYCDKMTDKMTKQKNIYVKLDKFAIITHV